VGTTTEESAPENYTFAEPRVVLSSSSGYFEISEWLPDSNRALIVERVVINGYEQYQSIQLFDPRTIKVQVYAQRDRASNQPPLWMEGVQAVIYPERRIVSWSHDENGKYLPSSLVERHVLWLGNGDPDRAQNLRDVEFHPDITPHERVIFSLAAKPDGSRMVSLEGDGMRLPMIYHYEVIQGLLGAERQVLFNAPWENLDEPRPLNLGTRMVWQPGTSHVLIYDYVSPTDPTFLLDVDTGQACGLEFGGWVYLARWSPNGRFLAVIKSRGAMIPFTLDYDLVVLDIVTGKFYQVNAKKLSPPDMMDIGVHKVSDFSWAPDNRHIAAIGSVNFVGTSPPPPTQRLYLVDFLSGQVDSIFPSYKFDGQCSYWGRGLAWSPDGSKILANCSDIYLISVKKSNL
jgi:WD40 repeat protein